MKIYRTSLLLLVSMVATMAVADSLYDNGPRGPDIDAWTINSGFAVSDTFTLSSNATVNGFAFIAWLFPGDTLISAEVSITSSEFGGTTYFDQTVNFTPSDCFTNAYGYNVCQENSSFNGPSLNSGTYWLNLQNASVDNGDPVYWDENSGVGCQSPGCPSSASESSLGTIPSESFTILGHGGTTGSTPEPSAILLFGSGVVGLAKLVRRRL